MSNVRPHMHLPELWLILLAAASPIAAVIGFAVQLRQLRKIKLENHKLELEIQQLRAKLQAEVTVLAIATFSETLKYGNSDERAVFSRTADSSPHSLAILGLQHRKLSIKPILLSLVLFALCLLASMTVLLWVVWK